MTEPVITVKVVQPIPKTLRSSVGTHILAVLIGLDVLANALLGGAAYMTISCRVGESMRDGGWASKVPWPAWWRTHCANSIFEMVV